MGKLFDMADDICLKFSEIDDITNTLREALQYQADNVNPDAQRLLAVMEILCAKMEKLFDKYEEFLYKIPQDL